jgi:protein-disulfide isomerase
MRIKFKILLGAVFAFTAAATVQLPSVSAQPTNGDALSSESILRDPDIPALGNPNGDITIVEYFDYRCPYCKKVHPELQKVVRDDGHIRLVFKDWPIFGDVSIYAAKLALAAKYQDKYPEAHEALISAPARLNEESIQEILAQAGIDVERVKRDLAENQISIDAILSRNHEQAAALGFQGTPAFIIGHFRIPGALDAANFKKAIADARAADMAVSPKRRAIPPQ